jgi:hypothetical protein
MLIFIPNTLHREKIIRYNKVKLKTGKEIEIESIKYDKV